MMFDQNYGFCRGCGKQILWTRTVAGNKMPCDPEMIRFFMKSRFEKNAVYETFVTPEGNVLRGIRSESGDRQGYISHFATCPKADQFKK